MLFVLYGCQSTISNHMAVQPDIYASVRFFFFFFAACSGEEYWKINKSVQNVLQLCCTSCMSRTSIWWKRFCVYVCLCVRVIGFVILFCDWTKRVLGVAAAVDMIEWRQVICYFTRLDGRRMYHKNDTVTPCSLQHRTGYTSNRIDSSKLYFRFRFFSTICCLLFFFADNTTEAWIR